MGEQGKDQDTRIGKGQKGRKRNQERESHGQGNMESFQQGKENPPLHPISADRSTFPRRPVGIEGSSTWCPAASSCRPCQRLRPGPARGPHSWRSSTSGSHRKSILCLRTRGRPCLAARVAPPSNPAEGTPYAGAQRRNSAPTHQGP